MATDSMQTIQDDVCYYNRKINNEWQKLNEPITEWEIFPQIENELPTTETVKTNYISPALLPLKCYIILCFIYLVITIVMSDFLSKTKDYEIAFFSVWKS